MYHPGMKRTICLLIAALLVGAGGVRAQAPAAGQNPAPSSPAMKTWFIRLIPPRPTFIEDMTPAEGAAMDQHYLYWKAQFERGVCVFGGPVLDPRGPYGVLAIRAASQEEAQALANGDPSVKAGINKVEVAEMKIAFLAKGQ
jgi:uncharacterized protein